MSDLLIRLDTMIGELTQAGSSRCSRSATAAQTPTGTAKPLETKVVPVVPVVPAEKQNIIRDIDISRSGEQSRQHIPKGKTPLSLSSKRTGMAGTTGTRQGFCGVERSRKFISNGNTGNREAWPEPEIPNVAEDDDTMCERLLSSRVLEVVYDWSGDEGTIPMPYYIMVPERTVPPPAPQAAFNQRAVVIELDANATPAALEEEKRTVPTAYFIDVGSPPGHGPTAPELIEDDLVAQPNAHQAEIVDERRQACCAECQEPITAEVTDWLGGLPVHHLCGITAWRREWWQDQRKDDDDEN